MKKNKNDDSARTSTILPFLDFGRGSLDSKMCILDIYYTLYSICRYELFLCLKCKETRAERRGDPSTSPTDINAFEFASVRSLSPARIIILGTEPGYISTF